MVPRMRTWYSLRNTISINPPSCTDCIWLSKIHTTKFQVVLIQQRKYQRRNSNSKSSGHASTSLGKCLGFFQIKITQLTYMIKITAQDFNFRYPFSLLGKTTITSREEQKQEFRLCTKTTHTIHDYSDGRSFFGHNMGTYHQFLKTYIECQLHATLEKQS